MQSPQDHANMAVRVAETDIKQEVMEDDDSVEELTWYETEQGFQIKDDPDKEIRYVNTQDYLDIGETVISQPHRAPPDVTTSPGESTRRSFKKNKKNDSEIATTIFQCGSCDYQTKHFQYLYSHKRVHTAEKPYKCEVCDYSTKYRSNLKSHERRHLPVSEKPFKCDVCGYRTTQKTLLKNHMKNHSPDNCYQCEVCDYCTDQQKKLTLHRKKHLKDMSYECRFCDYRTKYMGHLVYHVSTHSRKVTEKPYKCDICDYRSFHSLRFHIKKHSGEKPWERIVRLPLFTDPKSEIRKAARDRRDRNSLPNR